MKLIRRLDGLTIDLDLDDIEDLRYGITEALAEFTGEPADTYLVQMLQRGLEDALDSAFWKAPVFKSIRKPPQ